MRRMTSPHIYTDAPPLHPNLFLGGLQLLFWLFFHPAAWRNHIARLDPALRPDFCLADLRGAHWRIPAMRRTLAILYGVWPLLTGVLACLALGCTGWATSAPLMAVDLAIGLGAALGLAAGVGAAAGAVAGAAAGLLLGAVVGVGINAPFNAVFILAGGLGVGALSDVAAHAAARGGKCSFARQVSGVALGVALSGAAVGAVLVLVSGMPVGVLGGLALGAAVMWRTRSLWRGLAWGALLGVGGGLALDAAAVVPYDVARGLLLGLGSGVVISFLFALPYAVADRIAGPWAGAVAGAMGFGGLGVVAAWGLIQSQPALSLLTVPFLSAAGLLLGLTLSWWRPLLTFPFQAAWNFLLYRFDEARPADRPLLFRLHSAFWDEFQYLRMPGLVEHLVLAVERRPDEGRAALDYLSRGRHTWAARAAQIELDARGLETCSDVEEIAQSPRRLAAGDLGGPASALLRSFARIGQDAAAALAQESVYNQRLALSGLEDRLDGLVRELTRSDEPYAARFRPIAERWREIVAVHVRRLAETVEAQQEIDNPYVIGVPLTQAQEIFVGRADISARIEQLLLDRRRPPLLLYGQRRMGKTSLLINLGRLLPGAVVPLFVDLQGPATRAGDHVGLLYNLARGMAHSAAQQRGLALPPLPRETLADDPFTRFDEWLDAVEGALGERTALLALDEFESLDEALAARRFDEAAVLGMLRHLIQHRPRFKVLLAGSHTLEELQRWSSYLINVQVIHISYLKEDEARQLIERPVKNFALRYEPAAVERALALTRGHPFLTQLLCAEVIALKNEQPSAVRRLARLEDVEAALPAALEHGGFFFADIERNQVDAAGAAMLRFMAAQGEGAITNRFPDAPAQEQTLDMLARRGLIERAGGGWRFQVEMVRRWFCRG